MDTQRLYYYFYQALTQSKKKLIALVVLFVSISVLFIMLEKPKYKTSWVMLLPGTDRATTINLDNIGEARSAAKNAYGNVSVSPKNTYKEIALSYAVIEQASTDLDIEPYAFTKPRIKLVDQTPAMQFTLKGTDYKKLQHRAKVYHDALHTVLDKLRKNEIDRHYQGIEGNLAEAKQRLKIAREAIIDYQVKGGLVSDQQLELWAQNAEMLRTKKVDADVELAKETAKLSALLQQLQIDQSQARSIVMMQSNPKVVSILYSLTQLLAQQVAEHAKLAHKHPKRILIDREVSALSKELQTLLQPYPSLALLPMQKLHALLAKDATDLVKEVTATHTNISSLQSQFSTIERSLQEYQARIISHTKGAGELADLKRNHQIAEAIFSSALAKLDTGKLDIYATYPLTQLLTQPGNIVKRDRLASKLMVLGLMMVCGLLCLVVVLNQVRQYYLQEAE